MTWTGPQHVYLTDNPVLAAGQPTDGVVLTLEREDGTDATCRCTGVETGRATCSCSAPLSDADQAWLRRLLLNARQQLTDRAMGEVRRLAELRQQLGESRPLGGDLVTTETRSSASADDPQAELDRLVREDMDLYATDYATALGQVARRQPDLAERARTAAYLPTTPRGLVT